MTLITLKAIDGADRGREFADMPTPLTIGREEGNAIQLNDERVSRYHLKIQEDQNKIVLADLESTNGTKVNGESVQLWILRPGDVISVGRSILVYGSREEIAKRLASLRGVDVKEGVTMPIEDVEDDSESFSLDDELNLGDDPNALVALHTLMPPELPEALSPGQIAQMAEVLQYIHMRIRNLIDSVQMKNKTERVTLDQRQWQYLIDLQDRMANYLRTIGEPLE
jgi:pSer/pThr/pTyr-binding forkhead associated (FHA) protein